MSVLQAWHGLAPGAVVPLVRGAQGQRRAWGWWALLVGDVGEPHASCVSSPTSVLSSPAGALLPPAPSADAPLPECSGPFR